MVDHRLLQNLHFPNPALTAELRNALVHCPPGQPAFAELLAGVVERPTKRLAVANGGSELINVLGRLLGQTVAVPNFNEYAAQFSRLPRTSGCAGRVRKRISRPVHDSSILRSSPASGWNPSP
ncbi:hypothetical protein [Allokutzneria oryzae]|uniref:Uncharacterized protein n=1 Tax=Allokutzneria oryzae TaxID=1378989 RepID=A0ABV5ZX99_9PSEU